MAVNTPNYSLIKPGQDDFYDIEDFNTNADLIDAALQGLEVGKETPAGAQAKADAAEANAKAASVPVTRTVNEKELSADIVLTSGDVGAEPVIPGGSEGEYIRGNKSLGDFATSVRGAALTGLTTDADIEIEAADTVLSAGGKLQAQVRSAKTAARSAQDTADAALEAITNLTYTIDVLPSQSGALTYTGSAQSPFWNSYNPEVLTLGGTTTGTNAGSYTATFTPKEGYRWWDGTTAAKSATWTIAKAAGSLTIDKTSLSLMTGSLTGTIAVTRIGDGALTAYSSDTNVVTLSVSGTTVTATGRTTGLATITVNVSEGTNHTAPASKTCSVTVTIFSPILNNNTWAQIKAASDSGIAASLWNVGDTKTITINGKVGNTTFSNLRVDAFIIGFNHNSSREGANRIHFQIGKIGTVDVALIDSAYNTHQTAAGYFTMYLTGGNTGGWNSSQMRTTLLGSSYSPTSPLSGSLLAALPSDLRAVLKSCVKFTDNMGGGSNTASYVTDTTEYLFLLAEYECRGSRANANSAEQNYQIQYDYYLAGNPVIKYKYDNTVDAIHHWTRSPAASSDTGFCFGAATGAGGYGGGVYSYGIAPCFCV